MGRLSADTTPPAHAATPGGDALPTPAATPWSRHALVVVRVAVATPDADALARVARLAAGLGPGELLAVRSARPWPDGSPAGGPLRRVACAFATDDHETLVWPAPPDVPDDAGTDRLDVRGLPQPLPLVATARAVAAMAPGDGLEVIGAAGSPLLVDFLAGRAEVTFDPDASGGLVVTRLRRI